MRWMGWLLVFAAWTALAVVFAVASSLTYALNYQPPRWGYTLTMSATEWYAWALLTPLVAWVAARWRLTRPTSMRRAAALIAAGLPIAIAKITLTRVVRGITVGNDYFQITNLASQYFIYWGIVAAVHGLLYYREAQTRELRASQLEALLAETRLQMLNMQLQPHFLFNTLNTIAELVHQRPEAAERMITELSHLLRDTLHAGLVDRVPLDRELALLDRYVTIQRARFGDRLTVHINVADAAGNALVPNLLLQPLVENAIKHGLSARADAGTIEIDITRQADRLAIEVIDDGVGLPAETVKEGIGLANCRARLTAIYGSDFELNIADNERRGATVRITLPFQTAAPESPA